MYTSYDEDFPKASKNPQMFVYAIFGLSKWRESFDVARAIYGEGIELGGSNSSKAKGGAKEGFDIEDG